MKLGVCYQPEAWGSNDFAWVQGQHRNPNPTPLVVSPRKAVIALLRSHPFMQHSWFIQGRVHDLVLAQLLNVQRFVFVLPAVHARACRWASRNLREIQNCDGFRTRTDNMHVETSTKMGCLPQDKRELVSL